MPEPSFVMPGPDFVMPDVSFVMPDVIGHLMLPAEQIAGRGRQ